MSARVWDQQRWQRCCPSRRGGVVRAVKAPGGGRVFLQQARRFSCGRLTVLNTRFGLRNTRAVKWCAEYTSAQDEDVGRNGLGLGLVLEEEDVLSTNGHARSTEEVGDINNGHGSVSLSEVHINGHVNGHTQVAAQNGFKANGHVAESEIADDGASDAQAELDDEEYYVPVIGHRVLGVVVSGNHLKLDVDIGAANLAQLHVQNLVPHDRISIEKNKWVLADDAGAGDDGTSIGVPTSAHPYVLYDEDVFVNEFTADPLMVEIGTVLEMEVIGETVTGTFLLSSRKAASRVAWDRVVQIKDENEPFEVMITESNSAGLVARFEGLRAFLPNSELLRKPDTSTGETQDAYLGRTMWVTFVFAREIRGSIIISEKNAWIHRNLQLWSLHDGTVTRLFPYGALVQLGDTDLWGMIHISNIANARIDRVSDVFEVGERVKMLLVESPVPERFAFSTALLESEPGLMLRDKERVFREAEERATELRNSLSDSKQPTKDDAGENPPSWKVAKPISNWDWLNFINEEAPLS